LAIKPIGIFQTEDLRPNVRDSDVRRNGGKEQKRKTTQIMGERRRRLGRGYTAETAPFGAG